VIGNGAFPVKVIRTLDASKLKEGDAIEVETLGFQTPRRNVGSEKIEGHRLRGKGNGEVERQSQSELVIRFAKINFGDKAVLIQGIVQAVFPRPDDEDPRVFGIPPSGGTTGATNEIKTGSNLASTSHAQVVMTTQSTGVQGVPNLELGQGGWLSSKGKNVNLGVDIRMIIEAAFLQ
jgi:hypothetical protein